MLFAVSRSSVRLWLGALVFLLACQSGLYAQIGKVAGQDQPSFPVWTPRWRLLDCLPCKHPRCPPFDPNFGYHMSTWRMWPGTKPNVGYDTKRDLLLDQPTLVPKASEGTSSPGGASAPAKEPDSQARGRGAHFPTPLTTLPAVPEDGGAPNPGSAAPASPQG